MDKVLRRNHTPDFKTQVVLAILKGDKTRSEVGSQFGIHPTQVDKWKLKVLSGLPTLFTEGKNDLIKERDNLIEELYKQIGQLKVELDWLKKKMGLIR